MLPWWVSWLTAVGTVLGAYLRRRLYWQGHVVGLVNMALWWWITVGTQQWGLIAVNLFMAYNYVVGIIEWRRAGHSVTVARRAAAKRV